MKELICIVCPRGCHLKVDEANDYAVTDNSCPRGAAYRRCPVRTERAIDKSLLFKAMDALNGVTLHAPVHVGDVALENVCGTGVNVIVTREL